MTNSIPKEFEKLEDKTTAELESLARLADEDRRREFLIKRIKGEPWL